MHCFNKKSSMRVLFIITHETTMAKDHNNTVRKRIYGKRGVRVGEKWNWKMVKWVYGRKSTLLGNPIFVGVELGCLPHGFLFWALHRRWTGLSSSWISLLSSSSVSNWVVFLVDFSGGHGFLFSKRGIRVEEYSLRELDLCWRRTGLFSSWTSLLSSSLALDFWALHRRWTRLSFLWISLVGVDFSFRRKALGWER